MMLINKEQNPNMTIFIDPDKAAEENLTAFIIETTNEIGIEENSLKIMKYYLHKTDSLIILNDEILNSFSVSSGQIEECLLVTLLLNVMLAVLKQSS